MGHFRIVLSKLYASNLAYTLKSGNALTLSNTVRIRGKKELNVSVENLKKVFLPKTDN